MRLRKKRWVAEAIKEYAGIVVLPDEEYGRYKGNWCQIFGNQQPIYVEVGTGKGSFIAGCAQQNTAINYIGIEKEDTVLYYAVQKVANENLTNVRLVNGDVALLENIFAVGEIDRIYINFCDPWPKVRHAKRRLTHKIFLEKYRQVLKPGGQIHFKTDNEALFEFSLNEFSEYGLRLKNITFDLHHSLYMGNIMTEYERKFSELGMRIYRCEAEFNQ